MVGLATPWNGEDSLLSPLFGMAELWLMIRNSDTAEARFEQNTGLSGRSVVDILAGAVEEMMERMSPKMGQA